MTCTGWLPNFLCKPDISTRIFPVAEYAYTTVTIPSGQIGFMVCSKEAGQDLKNPRKKLVDLGGREEYLRRVAS
jgi:spermidine synthase